MTVPTQEQIEKFIKAADDALGPDSDALVWCRNLLRSALEHIDHWPLALDQSGRIVKLTITVHAAGGGGNGAVHVDEVWQDGPGIPSESDLDRAGGDPCALGHDWQPIPADEDRRFRGGERCSRPGCGIMRGGGGGRDTIVPTRGGGGGRGGATPGDGTGFGGGAG